jgi:GNAT superfamily N-acetyltransferase
MNKKVQVMSYHSQFKQAFRKLNFQWIEQYFRVEAKDIEQVENPEACIDSGGQIFFVILEDEIAGTCALYKVNSERYELAKMAVDPRFQGLGLGDLLMKSAEQWAREQRASEIFLLSNTVLEPAIRLYKRHGYEVVHLGPHPDYERCNIELKKQLGEL